MNPVYVKADYRLYEFFKVQGAQIVNNPEDFIGTNGAYLYSGENKTRKTNSLQGHVLVIAPHQGMVDSETWLKCRSKCLNNKSVAKLLKAKAIWIAGKIKCAKCGYALVSQRFTAAKPSQTTVIIPAAINTVQADVIFTPWTQTLRMRLC